MVFVSLEDFLHADVAFDDSGYDDAYASAAIAKAATQRPPVAPVHVLITPGSPGKTVANVTASSSSSSSSSSSTSSAPAAAPHRRGSLRRAMSSSLSSLSALSTRSKSATTCTTRSSTSTSSSSSSWSSTHASTPTSPPLVVYVCDRDVRHKWVLRKRAEEVTALRHALRALVVDHPCRKFACCGPLRRTLAQAPHTATGSAMWSKRRSRTDTQALRARVLQEYVNDLLHAVLERDDECASTTRAWALLQTFLGVDEQRQQLADEIVLSTTSTLSCNHEEGGHEDAVVDWDGDVDVDVDGDAAHGVAHSECPICCASLATDATSRLPCGHTYHSDCVRVWLRVQHSCPVCRLPVRSARSPRSGT